MAKQNEHDGLALSLRREQRFNRPDMRDWSYHTIFSSSLDKLDKRSPLFFGDIPCVGADVVLRHSLFLRLAVVAANKEKRYIHRIRIDSQHTAR